MLKDIPWKLLYPTNLIGLGILFSAIIISIFLQICSQTPVWVTFGGIYYFLLIIFGNILKNALKLDNSNSF